MKGVRNTSTVYYRECDYWQCLFGLIPSSNKLADLLVIRLLDNIFLKTIILAAACEISITNKKIKKKMFHEFFTGVKAISGLFKLCYQRALKLMPLVLCPQLTNETGDFTLESHKGEYPHS